MAAAKTLTNQQVTDGILRAMGTLITLAEQGRGNYDQSDYEALRGAYYRLGAEINRRVPKAVVNRFPAPPQ